MYQWRWRELVMDFNVSFRTVICNSAWRELVMDFNVSFRTVICNSAWRMHKIKFYSAKHNAGTGILFYMTIRIHSDSFTWRQTATFQLAVSRGPRL